MPKNWLAIEVRQQPALLGSHGIAHSNLPAAEVA
jgi:hypothetical protein